MRVTKDIAQNVAGQLCSDRKNKLKAYKASQQSYVRSVYLKQVPVAVKDMFEVHPAYFNTTTAIYINGPGLPQGYKTYSLGDSLPSKIGSRITVDEKEATKIQQFEDKLADMEKELDELIENIETALYNLRTYSNVEKEFPEAFKLLPPTKVNTGLMVNIKDIRCRLDSKAC